MQKAVSLYDAIVLGTQFGLLSNPQVADKDAYQGTIEPFRRFLQYFELRTTDEAASVLSKTTFYFDKRTHRITPDSAHTLNYAMGIIGKVLAQEASPRKMITLKTGDVSDKLRNLGRVLTNLTQAQQHLLEETILCIECDAFRAAAVMAWNLAYDRIRQWVFDNRLPDFNKGMAGENPTKAAIADFADFFKKDAPGESLFFRSCHHQDSGPIIGGELYDTLVQHLRFRNKYAHSTEFGATAEKTRGYIDHLLDIITTAPFG